MAQTAQAIRRQWDKDNLTRYSLMLNNEGDKVLIDYLKKCRENGHSINSTIKSMMYKALE